MENHVNGMHSTLFNVTDCKRVIACVVRCTEDPSCAAANYDDDTSQCELLNSPIVWLTQQHNAKAVIGDATGEFIT